MKFRIFNSNLLIRASYFNAIIVLVRAISGIVTSKVIALFLGPSGLALLGNLRSFIQTASSVTAEGYHNATIRYVSEYKDSELKQKKTVATIFQLSLGLAFLIGIILWVFSSTWSAVLFKTEAYAYVIKVLAIGLPFFSYNLLVIYVLNGLERHKKLVIVNSILSVGNMLVTISFAIKFGLQGALVGIILGPMIVFIINFFALAEKRLILFYAFKFELFSIKALKNISIYFLMAAYSTVIVSITFLLIRNLIIENLSVEEAGYWEAMNRISSFYLMFFISLTSFYLLPRLSKTNSFEVFKKEIKSFYVLIIPVLIIVFALIYFLRYLLLNILLSEEFIPTSELFFWRLIGDFINVIAIVLVKQFHAKLLFKAYLFSNGLLSLLYFCLSYFFIDIYGLVGVVKAYAFSYMVYLPIVIIFIYNYYKRNKIN
ncbi:O-antigen translocase [Winogradskyella haliclonae]|uniref:LPS biosynthesis protein n=1 Tax=Winogradskyella haliclonae TaxID=2048558 RepID=A0ABQ2BZP8_9FLAO|nr:O-antigen translocase [Winogradskyella haliclonae]GGI57027.1 LPS biosynthesis protein [Winogradskyella haliclonae]